MSGSFIIHQFRQNHRYYPFGGGADLLVAIDCSGGHTFEPMGLQGTVRVHYDPWTKFYSVSGFNGIASDDGEQQQQLSPAGGVDTKIRRSRYEYGRVGTSTEAVESCTCGSSEFITEQGGPRSGPGSGAEWSKGDGLEKESVLESSKCSKKRSRKGCVLEPSKSTLQRGFDCIKYCSPQVRTVHTVQTLGFVQSCVHLRYNLKWYLVGSTVLISSTTSYNLVQPRTTWFAPSSRTMSESALRHIPGDAILFCDFHKKRASFLIPGNQNVTFAGLHRGAERGRGFCIVS